MKAIKKLGHTDVQYKIMTFGKDFDIGAGTSVTVQYEHNQYQAKMHSKAKGRIDGLAKLYQYSNFSEGDVISAEWDENTRLIIITKCGNEYDGDIVSEGSLDNVDLDNNYQYDSLEKAKSEFDYGWRLQEDQDAIHKRELEDIFTDLDSVPAHKEFYFNSGHEDFVGRMQVNRDWILYWDPYKNMLQFMTETGNFLVKEKLPDCNNYSFLLGFNNEGVWFAEYGTGYTWDDSEWINRIVCCDIVNKKVKAYKINQKKGVLLLKNIYIYGDELFYFCRESETIETAYRVNEGGEHKILSLALHEDDSSHICRVVCGQDKYAVVMNTDFYDKAQGVQISSVCRIYQKSSGVMEDEIKSVSRIKTIDFNRKCAITELSVIDNINCSFAIPVSPPQGMEWWVLKPLYNNPGLERIATFKQSGKPAVFPVSECSSQLLYFDFENCYVAPHYSKLCRYARNGKEYCLSGGGHGVTESILVSSKYVYCDYDANGVSQLPRNFDDFEGLARTNPQATLILKERVGIDKWN
ncbi:MULTISPECIES: hypothetical protein [unclassified Butyrivibrio]|uniref:hypothetical protein n=1 Tax=unclassified Butyrivibrio TaxID=2639466 RepID=UPI0003B48321|nr:MULTISPECIES: hypothetical protein [unclassified Butyrivibrio]SEL21337.1 hypothetical protein SAMN04487770_10772 [Butyrivibrio sp. ob235]